ncbi:MAG: hypothetical protein HYY05_04165 [Chloroflexi bacterium]|nr:hypothetical protein [Chloroflexota bacterium]
MARVTVVTDLLDQPDRGATPHLDRVASLSVGSRVRVVEQKDGWMLVETMGMRGYVPREALELL